MIKQSENEKERENEEKERERFIWTKLLVNRKFKGEKKINDVNPQLGQGDVKYKSSVL